MPRLEPTRFCLQLGLDANMSWGDTYLLVDFSLKIRICQWWSTRTLSCPFMFLGPVLYQFATQHCPRTHIVLFIEDVFILLWMNRSFCINYFLTEVTDTNHDFKHFSKNIWSRMFTCRPLVSCWYKLGDKSTSTGF